jgi:hypothetical protein
VIRVPLRAVEVKAEPAKVETETADVIPFRTAA